MESNFGRDWELYGFPFKGRKPVRLLSGAAGTLEPAGYEQSKEKDLRSESERRGLRIYLLKTPPDRESQDLYDEFQIEALIGKEQFDALAD